MDEVAKEAWIEENGDPEIEWVDGPEHRRGPWEYQCTIRVADFVHEVNDKLLILRSNAEDGPEFEKPRFSYSLPPRDPLYWQFGPSGSDEPANTGDLRRYADVFAAAEPLVDFDAAWQDRTDITPARRAQLREAVDHDWTLIQDPVDQEYTAAYREAKRLLAQSARRTPDQLRAWLEATGLNIGIERGNTETGSVGIVTLAFPEGAAPDAGPEPEAHPHGPGIDATESLRQGWSR